VDLHLIPDAVPTAEERAALDALLGSDESLFSHDSHSDVPSESSVASGIFRRGQRHLLLPALQALQARVGYISPGGLNYLCERLDVPPAEAWGVASFYALLSLEPAPPRVAHVCDDIACRVKGALGICAHLESTIGPTECHTADGAATWHRSPCLGLCELAPAVYLQQAGERPIDAAVAPAEATAVSAALQSGLGVLSNDPSIIRSVPQVSRGETGGLRLLRRVGTVDPESLDAYLASGGYTALRRAIEIGPEAVLQEVNDSRLVGRGGAAFPTGRKWQDVARAPARPHYVICNADESEPGTFKDRVLMEGDPFALVEAMTIAGFATGSQEGFIYIRNEYPLATKRLRLAIEIARRNGLLGSNILNTGFDFEIEIRRGGGAYICGEETSLFNSIEGFRGEPRSKPPFPTQSGLFRKPTLVNNVETLVNVLDIVENGAALYTTTGSEGSSGTKLFCLSGHVVQPGVYEVPFGMNLRALLDLAGGVPSGRPIQAVLLGGAAGSFVTPEELDVPLTFEGTRAIGSTLGSGVVMVFDDTVDLSDILLRIAAFFRDESCGQCVPCRVGTVRQEEALVRLQTGRTIGTVADELALLDDLGLVMRDASICGLGHTAASAVLSGIQKFGVFRNGNLR
jgi:NADH-quinone oxidoreductase subunit F